MMPTHRRGLPAWLIGGLAALAMAGAPSDASAHGHPAVIDPNAPDAWKYKLCAEMTTVAIQALHQRDRGRPKTVYPDDGGPGSRIANAIVDKVYDEPAIASPKRAEAFGRAYCNEQLDER
jgi:hypothetical protein